MKTRVIVGVVGLPLLLLVLLVFPPVATAVLVSAMSVIAVYELLSQTGLVRNKALMIAAAVMAVAVCFWSYSGCQWKWALVGIWAYFLTMTLLLVSSHATLAFTEVCISMFSGILIPLMLSALTRILIMQYGKFYIFVPLILSFGTDTGAYFAGRAFGRHKMAPIVSPKKTWEGAIGGAAAAIVGMLFYCLILRYAFSFKLRYAAVIVYGILGAVSCILGDLVFSVIKRQTGIKDYGNLLPGHGGILDRFDSMTLVAPLAEALLLLIPLIVK